MSIYKRAQDISSQNSCCWVLFSWKVSSWSQFLCPAPIRVSSVQPTTPHHRGFRWAYQGCLRAPAKDIPFFLSMFTGSPLRWLLLIFKFLSQNRVSVPLITLSPYLHIQIPVSWSLKARLMSNTLDEASLAQRVKSSLSEPDMHLLVSPRITFICQSHVVVSNNFASCLQSFCPSFPKNNSPSAYGVSFDSP